MKRHEACHHLMLIAADLKRERGRYLDSRDKDQKFDPTINDVRPRTESELKAHQEWCDAQLEEIANKLDAIEIAAESLTARR